MSIHQPISRMSMQDVLDWAIRTENTDYANAVRRTSDWFDGKSLRAIPADLSAIKAALPLRGFDPARNRSEPAYKAMRRKIIAAIKNATGEIAAARERRARQDEWACLLERLEPHAVNRRGIPSPQMLIPVRNLADLARQHGVAPGEVSQEWLQVLRPLLGTNEWKGLQRALQKLNDARDIAEIATLLPAVPFPKAAPVRSLKTPGVPEHIDEEIIAWVDNATCKEWDPVEEVHVETHSKSDKDFKRAALRQFVSVLGKTSGGIARDATLSDLLTPENATPVVRYWSAHAGEKGHISARTAHDYLKHIHVVMARNGADPQPLINHLKANRFLREGKAASGRMSPSSRKFCETLLGSTKLTLTFLSLHVHMRNRAVDLQRACSKAGEDPTASQIVKLRQLGTVAALCAIETRGAPIRIDNALSLRFRGSGRNFHMPNRNTDFAVISLSPDETKNNVEIWAPIKRGQLNGLEVIEWYVQEIRPLFPGAEDSDHLFPGLNDPGGLRYGTLLEWFKTLTREAGLPMMPHKFRHGLASLLLQKNPGRWDLLERLLDDAPMTVRRNYAWVNKRAQREDVMRYVLNLSEIA